jgi:uncharacterized membrane protein YfcA
MYLEFALIGIAAGYLAGFLGIGGGFVVVPALTWLFLRDASTASWAIHLAVATSLATHTSGVGRSAGPSWDRWPPG